MFKFKARFYINEISEFDRFKKVRKNFESIINAAFLAGEYDKKSSAYQILGADYETVKLHLITTRRSFKPRSRYKIHRRIINCSTIQELIQSYNYRNLYIMKSN